MSARITKPAPSAYVIVPAALAVGAAYLTWRLGWTRAGTSPWLFWPLWLAEATVFVELARMTFEMWTLRCEGPVAPTATKRPTRSVDVVVVCTDEPVDVLRATLLACNTIRGEHRTIALDTVGRPELAELTWEAGAEHLVASSEGATDAESHLNAALPHLDGDLVTVLHGSDVALPNLIDELSADFEDETLWLAQGHQTALRSTRDEQATTAGRHGDSLGVLQPGKAHHRASYWCGSGAMLRRSAVVALGGVPTETATPAFQLSMRAHRRGWTSAYHDEPVVLTLPRVDLRHLVERNTAAAEGHLAALTSSDSPLARGGLGLAQRMAYLGTAASYLGGPRRVVLVAVLSATLLTGALPLSADPVLLVSSWGMWIGLVVLSRRALTGDDHHELTRLVDRWLLMGAHCRGWLGLLRGPSRSLSSKGAIGPALSPLIVPIVAGGLLTTALFARLVDAIGLPALPAMPRSAATLSTVAALCILGLLACALVRGGLAATYTPGASIRPLLASAFQADAVSEESSGNSSRGNQRASRISADLGAAAAADAS